MRRRNKLVFAAVLAVVLALAIAIPASAATDSTASATDPAPCGVGYGGMFGGGGVSTTVSELLGMDPAELAAQRQAGKSLADIAASKGVSTDALLSTMLAARKAALDEAIAAGRISQEQADYMYENMGERLSERINETDVGPFGGQGRGGRGNCGGTCEQSPTTVY